MNNENTQKKIYVAPAMEVVDLKVKNELLQSSDCSGFGCLEDVDAG